MENQNSQLLDLIDEKIAEAKAAAERGEKPKPKPATRAAINKANAQKSTGPKSAAGKAASAANSLKHGFFANITRLDPTDAPTYQNLLADFRQGLHPDGPIEDLCCRELSMLQARLQRLESIEFALIMGNVETNPATPKTMYRKDEFNDEINVDYDIDLRALAQSFTAAGAALDRVHKIETHLRRAYNRTFLLLQRLQRDRLRPPSHNPSRHPAGHLRNPDLTPARDPIDRETAEQTHSSPTPQEQITSPVSGHHAQLPELAKCQSAPTPTPLRRHP